MRRVILSSVACPAPTTFFHIISQTTLFFFFLGGGGVFEYKTCVLILPTKLSETFLIVRRIERDIIINVGRSLRKVPVYRGDHGGTVVKVLCYKSEGRCFDPRWCPWNFSVTQSFRSHSDPEVDSASNRNEYQKLFLGVKAARA